MTSPHRWKKFFLNTIKRPQHNRLVSTGVLLTLLLVLTGAGCIRISSNANSAVLYESFDGGKTWAPGNKLLSTQGATTLPMEASNTFMFDPTDPQTLYWASRDGALYQSTNSAQSWKLIQKKADPYLALDIDPRHPCTLYVSTGVQIQKSIDCGRRWDTRMELPKAVTLLSVKVNPLRPEMVMASSSRGDVYLSVDEGTQWVSPLRIPDSAVEIVFSLSSVQDVYVFGSQGTVYRSSDSGKNWTDLSSALKAVTSNSALKSVFLNPLRSEEIILATQHHVVRSVDRGASWKPLSLLTTTAVTAVHALAVDPQDSQVLYYANATTLYRSADGGASWQSFSLPSDREASILLIDPQRRGHLYLTIKP